MQDNSFSIKNLFTNLSKQQKIAAGLILPGILIVLAIMVPIINSAQEGFEDYELGDHDSSNESDTTVGVGQKWDSNTTNTNDDDNNDSETVEVPVSTSYNDDHEYTLIDYLPYSAYVFLDYDDADDTSRVYYSIEENTAIEKGIVISVDSCDVEGNTAAAQEYLKSIPVDLSEYTVVYQTHTGEVPCDVK